MTKKKKKKNLSYPEFMQRRSTRPDKAIVEDVDIFGLPSALQQQQQQAAAANENQQTTTAAATEQQYQPKLKCVKDIWQAAIEGDVECLEANVKLGACLSQLGQPIMSSADSHNNNNGVGQIWGPLFDRCALFKATPLQYACAYNRIEAAAYLLDQGASWEQLSSTGVSAKDYARRRNYVEILKLIEAKEIQRKK
jgi:hypothetical protein